MSEGVSGRYLVRDPQGNVYGPADAQMLRAWVAQGRIVAGMAIAAQETREWVPAAEHPAVADLLRGGGAGAVVPRLVALQYLAVETPRFGMNSNGPSVRAHPLGILSVVFGVVCLLAGCIAPVPILGWCIALPISGLTAIAAVTLGSLAIWQIRANPPAYTGKGMAVAGVAMGAIVLLLCCGVGAVAIIHNMLSR